MRHIDIKGKCSCEHMQVFQPGRLQDHFQNILTFICFFSCAFLKASNDLGLDGLSVTGSGVGSARSRKKSDKRGIIFFNSYFLKDLEPGEMGNYYKEDELFGLRLA